MSANHKYDGRDSRARSDIHRYDQSDCIKEAGTPIPDRVCGMCCHYITGGYCGRSGHREVGYLWTACNQYTTEKPEYTMEATPKTTPTTKVCKACGRELPAEAFGRHALTRDGLQPVCRECRSKAEKGNPKYGRRKKHGIVPAPAAHVPIFTGPAVQVTNPIVQEIPDHDMVKELRRRGYEVKCTKTIEL